MSYAEWDTWVIKLEQFIQHELKMTGWKDISYFHSERLKSIGEKVKAWVDKHPAPRKMPLKVKLPPPPPPGVHGVGNMNHKIMEAQHNYRMFRPRGGRGGSSLIGLVTLLGGATVAGAALKIGAFAVKWWVEDKIFEAIDKNFVGPVVSSINYAAMPTTKADLDYRYMNYCDFSLARVANYGITPHLLPKDEWCWQEYGIDMSVLK